MNDEVEAAVLPIDGTEDAVDLLVAGDVARNHEGIGERARQLADVLLEPFALIRQGERRAFTRRRLRDRPRERSLVGDTHDQADLSGKGRSVHDGRKRVSASACFWSRAAGRIGRRTRVDGGRGRCPDPARGRVPSVPVC